MKQMYIGGRWIGARDERTIPVVSPSDGESFERIPRGGAHEVDLAVAAARAELRVLYTSAAEADDARQIAERNRERADALSAEMRERLEKIGEERQSSRARELASELAVAEAHASSARRTGGSLYACIKRGPVRGLANAPRTSEPRERTSRMTRASGESGRPTSVRAASSTRVPTLGG